MLGQIMIINIGGQFFSVAPISLSDWIIIVVATSPVLLIGELAKIIHREEN